MKRLISTFIMVILLFSCNGKQETYRGIVIDKTKALGGLTVDKPIYFLVYDLNNGIIVNRQVNQNDFYSFNIGDSVTINY